jgi:hypothetical protein
MFECNISLIIIDSENLVPRRSSGHANNKKQSSIMDLHIEELEHVGHDKDVGNPCSCQSGNTDT